MDLLLILKAIDAMGPVVARLDDVKALIDRGVALLKEDDQAVAQEAYADLIAENDEGHARLQDKLAAAAAR